MDLRTYLNDAGTGAVTRLAESIGVHRVLVSQWAAKTRPVPVQHCKAIVSATGNAVSLSDLRPDDWQQIWGARSRAVKAANAIKAAARATAKAA